MLKFFAGRRSGSDARYRQVDAVMAVEHGTKTVLLDPQSEQFYSLDTTAQRIWALIAEPRTRREIVTALRADFDVAEEELDADVSAFLAELANVKLVEAV